MQGSLTNDVVWEKSDIDATVVVRDQKITVRNFCLDADGIVMNMYVIDRSDYVRMLERGLGGSMSQSFNSHSKVMYTTDPSITEMVEKNKIIGERDAERSALFIACDIVCMMEKCEKWLYVKKDLLYCRYYILKTAESIARLEICLNKEAPLREVIQRAAVLNPALIERFYTYPLNNVLGEDELHE
ncbi:MAG: nucleotidyltransferase, partial [Oscillospiraceae bacterium]|nr:nucleotidyltransferase [Oscillospiraceae bacterium]